MKKIKNISGSQQKWCGKYFEDQDIYTIAIQEEIKWAKNENVHAAIQAGDAEIYDGETALSASDGEAFIKKIMMSNVSGRSEGTTDPALSIVVAEVSSVTSVSHIENTEEHTTSSTSFSAINNMSLTPEAGKYLIHFSCSLETSGVNTEGEVALFKDDTVIGPTIREIRNTVSLLGIITISTNDMATPSSTTTVASFDGQEVLSAQFRKVTGGSLKAGERSLTLVKIKEDE